MKKFKLNTLVVVALILGLVVIAGCSIESHQLNKAVEACKDKGGIYEIMPKLGDATFVCNNGEQWWNGKNN